MRKKERSERERGEGLVPIGHNRFPRLDDCTGANARKRERRRARRRAGGGRNNSPPRLHRAPYMFRPNMRRRTYFTFRDLAGGSSPVPLASDLLHLLPLPVPDVSSYAGRDERTSRTGESQLSRETFEIGWTLRVARLFQPRLWIFFRPPFLTPVRRRNFSVDLCVAQISSLPLPNWRPAYIIGNRFSNSA